MFKKNSVLVLLVIVMTMIVTACGSGNKTVSEDKTANENKTVSEDKTTNEDKATNKDETTKEKKTTLDKIKEKNEMVFAMTGQYPPFNFINEDGDLVGFDIDIANALAEKIGVEAKPKTVAWDGIIAGLQGERFDTIIGSMAITDDRLKEVNFTDPYYISGAQLFVREDSEITGVDAIGDGNVGIVTGTTFQDYLINEVGLDEKQIKQFDSDVDNIRSLTMKMIDGLVTDKLVGMNSAKNYDAAIRPAGDPLYEEKCAIAVRKEDKDFLEALNKALQEIKDDGTYAEISKKWFGDDISQ